MVVTSTARRALWLTGFSAIGLVAGPLACSSSTDGSTTSAGTGDGGTSSVAMGSPETPAAPGAAEGGTGEDDGGRYGEAASICGSSSTPPSGAPLIFNAVGPVAAGETALLFGGQVGSGATVKGTRLGDSDPGLPPGSAPCLPTDAVALDVVQTSGTAAMAVIPASWMDGIYAVVVANGSGEGAPVLVNRPRIDWVHGGAGGALVPGGSFEVYGRNLGTSPSAWLTSASGGITALVAATAAVGPSAGDGYVETFAVPALAAGSYTLHLHNGHGGSFAFSDGFAVTVGAAAVWPTTVCTRWRPTRAMTTRRSRARSRPQRAAASSSSPAARTS